MAIRFEERTSEYEHVLSHWIARRTWLRSLQARGQPGQSSAQPSRSTSQIGSLIVTRPRNGFISVRTTLAMSAPCQSFSINMTCVWASERRDRALLLPPPGPCSCPQSSWEKSRLAPQRTSSWCGDAVRGSASLASFRRLRSVMSRAIEAVDRSRYVSSLIYLRSNIDYDNNPRPIGPLDSTSASCTPLFCRRARQPLGIARVAYEYRRGGTA